MFVSLLVALSQLRVLNRSELLGSFYLVLLGSCDFNRISRHWAFELNVFKDCTVFFSVLYLVLLGLDLYRTKMDATTCSSLKKKSPLSFFFTFFQDILELLQVYLVFYSFFS